MISAVAVGVNEIELKIILFHFFRYLRFIFFHALYTSSWILMGLDRWRFDAVEKEP